MTRLAIITTALASTLLSLSLASSAGAETTYLTAAHMVDTVAGRVVDNPAVVIENGKITAVGTKTSLAAPKGAKRIDLGTKTILPGLIDMHVHITSRADMHGYRALTVTPVTEAISGVANAAITLRAGYTTVRNVGAGGYTDVALADAIESGEVPGPRIIPSGPAIGATGGHCDDNLLPNTYNIVGEAVADGPVAIRAMVRKIRKYGAKSIKFCATGGVFSKGDTVGGQQYTLEEMTALVSEAHMLGLKVAAHAHGASGIKDAIRAGADTIEHASLADEEAFALAKAHAVAFSMDIYNDDYILSEGEKVGILPESLEKERMIGLKQRQTFQAAFKAGVTMVFGTDAGVYPHGDNGRQFAKMVEWGMTPMQALQAATTVAAKTLGDLGTDIGSISPGKSADIIAVNTDPTVNIKTMESVSFVMKSGTVF